MAEYRLDQILQALADPTRRAVIGRLGHGPASVGELAEPFAMALPSFMKHVQVLEAAGLIETYKQGRVRTCTVRPDALGAVADWLADQRALWDARSDRLERFALQQQKKDSA